MPNKEEELCAPAAKLTAVADLGLEFAAIMKKEVALAKELGMDVTDITKTLKDGVVRLKAVRKRLRI